MRQAIQSIRVHMKSAGEGKSEYDRGKRAGLKLAMAFLDGAPGTKRLINAGPGGCPDCFATLRGDGSCCDCCGWVKQA
jgi:hypothetical protein